jgi:hypothetical protein
MIKIKSLTIIVLVITQNNTGFTVLCLRTFSPQLNGQSHKIFCLGIFIEHLYVHKISYNDKI